jgi:hypothetical protein
VEYLGFGLMSLDLDFGFRVQDVRSRVWGLGFRIRG